MLSFFHLVTICDDLAWLVFHDLKKYRWKKLNLNVRDQLLNLIHSKFFFIIRLSLPSLWALRRASMKYSKNFH